MISKNIIEQRKAQRNLIIERAYVNFFDGGKTEIVNLGSGGLNGEVLLAYQYLTMKKYLAGNKLQGKGEWEISITGDGIDYAEENLVENN